jgi:hypothetical protein
MVCAAIVTAGVSVARNTQELLTTNNHTTTTAPALGCISGATHAQNRHRGLFPL